MIFSWNLLVLTPIKHRYVQFLWKIFLNCRSKLKHCVEHFEFRNCPALIPSIVAKRTLTVARQSHFFSCVKPCCLNMLNNAHAGYINKSVTDRYWTTCLIRRRGNAFIAVDIYATVHSTVSTPREFDSKSVQSIFNSYLLL